jgi:hypothetical protein
LRFAGVHDGLQKCSRGQNDGASMVDCIAANAHAHDDSLTAINGRLLDQQFFYYLLP